MKKIALKRRRKVCFIVESSKKQRERERENGGLVLCEGAETMRGMGRNVLQGLSLQSKRRHVVRFRACKFIMLGTCWDPSNRYQFSYQIQPWRFSPLPPHLGGRVIRLLRPRFGLRLYYNPGVFWFYFIFLFVFCSDVFNLVGCLLEPATVSDLFGLTLFTVHENTASSMALSNPPLIFLSFHFSSPLSSTQHWWVLFPSRV